MLLGDIVISFGDSATRISTKWFLGDIAISFGDAATPVSTRIEILNWLLGGITNSFGDAAIPFPIGIIRLWGDRIISNVNRLGSAKDLTRKYYVYAPFSVTDLAAFGDQMSMMARKPLSHRSGNMVGQFL